MQQTIIGRESEKAMLEEILQSTEPELLAIYGRRRVGKTFLIKSFYKNNLVFSCSGQYNGKTKEQLVNFARQLELYFPTNNILDVPENWQEALFRLQQCLDTTKGKVKKVVFFDELPWLDTHKSGFLSSFGYFWNMYASQRDDLIVVICGSAASWIINKVINNKGGLHNRITRKIRLLPFTLGEMEKYLLSKSIQFDRYQLLQLYMVMGGVPAYLNAIEKGKSAAQNIEKICFEKDGMLNGEFDNLYAALFNRPDRHIQVIEALAKKNKGLTRNEIIKTAKFITGGGITEVLNELTESGFITKVYPFGKKERDSLFRLTDEFSLFYFRFIQHQKSNEKGMWLSRQATTAYTIWGGYAFENICFKHIDKIKRALQIGAVQTNESAWMVEGNIKQDGAQIDLLIDRADHCINICEMKFSLHEFSIEKKYALGLERKVSVFRESTKTRKTLFLTMITTYGVKKNGYYTNLIANEVTIEDLFH